MYDKRDVTFRQIMNLMLKETAHSKAISELIANECVYFYKLIINL
jgi:hypothetical protein